MAERDFGRQLLCFLALVLAVFPGRALADDGYRTGRFELGLNPGAYIPVGISGSLMSPSGGIQLSVGYQYNKWSTFGAELGYDPGHTEGGITKGPASADFNNSGSVEVVPFTSNVKEKFLQFTPTYKLGQWFDINAVKFRPYIIGGLGLYQEWFNSGFLTVNGSDQTTNKPVGPVVLPVQSAGNAYFGLNTGAGFEIQVDENAALGFDLRYARIFKPLYNAQFIIPSLRIMYLF
jgi:opacity protein-like surface antigen